VERTLKGSAVSRGRRKEGGEGVEGVGSGGGGGGGGGADAGQSCEARGWGKWPCGGSIEEGGGGGARSGRLKG